MATPPYPPFTRARAETRTAVAHRSGVRLDPFAASMSRAITPSPGQGARGCLNGLPAVSKSPTRPPPRVPYAAVSRHPRLAPPATAQLLWGLLLLAVNVQAQRTAIIYYCAETRVPALGFRGNASSSSHARRKCCWLDTLSLWKRPCVHGEFNSGRIFDGHGEKGR